MGELRCGPGSGRAEASAAGSRGRCLALEVTVKGAFVPRAHVQGPTLMRVWAAHLHQRMPSSPYGAHAPGGQSKGHRGSARVSDLTVTSMSPSQEVWRDGRREESKGNLQPFLVPVTPSSLFSEQPPSWEEGSPWPTV